MLAGALLLTTGTVGFYAKNVQAADDLTKDRVAWIDFDDETYTNKTSGGVAPSPITTGMATYAGAMTYVDGRGDSGKALKVSEGSNYGIKLNQNALGDNFSVSFWVNPDGTLRGNGALCLMGYHSPENWISVAGNNDTQSLKIWGKGGAYGTHTPFGYADISAANWHNVVVTGSGTAINYWVDGKKVATGKQNNLLGSAESDILFGSNNWDKPVNAVIDDIMVYNRMLTDNEIAFIQQDVNDIGEYFEKVGFTVDDVMVAKSATADLQINLDSVLKDVDSTIKYTVSDETIATIDEGTGVVTGVAAGDTAATVEITIDGHKVSRDFNIEVADVEPMQVGLVADYNFNDSTLNDTVDTGRVASTFVKGRTAFAGDVKYVDGKSGKALNLNKEYGIRLNTPNVGKNFTVSLWTNLKGDLGWANPIVNLTNDDNTNWMAYAGRSGVTTLLWAVGGSYSGNEQLFDTNLTKNKWQHVVLSGDENTVKLYVDGKLINSAPNKNQPLVGATADVLIGVNFWDTCFNGYVDDIKVYKRTLSDEEVVFLKEDVGSMAELFTKTSYTASNVEVLINEEATTDIKFGNATVEKQEKTISYALADSSIAEINATTGKITPKKAGTTTVTASVTIAGTKIDKDFTLKVKSLGELFKETGFETEDVDVKPGEKKTNTITITSEKLEGESYTRSYSVVDGDIAEINDSNGEVTGKKAGTTKATVTITMDGQSVSKDFNITVSSIGDLFKATGFTTGDIEVAVGKTKTNTITFNNATVAKEVYTRSYVVEDETVATVDNETGVVSGLSVGTTKVTVTVTVDGESLSQDFNITVIDTLKDGLVADYNFDESSLKNAVSGVVEATAYTGGTKTEIASYAGDLAYVDGMSGKALKVDVAKHNYGIRLNKKNLGKTFTLSYWTKPDSDTLGRNKPLSFIGYHSPEQWVAVAGANADETKVRIWENGNGVSYVGDNIAEGQVSLSSTEWSNIIVTSNETETSFYINGKKISTYKSNTPLSQENGDVFFGPSFWDQPVDTAYDDIKLYNRVLSDAEIKSLIIEPIENEFKKTTLSLADIEMGKTDYFDVAVELPKSIKDNASFEYEIADTSVAEVDDKGRITAKGLGETTVTAKVTVGKTTKDVTAKVTVKVVDINEYKIASFNFDNSDLKSTNGKYEATARVKGLGEYSGDLVFKNDTLDGKGKALKVGNYGIELNTKNIGQNYTVSAWVKRDATIKENTAILFTGYHSPENWFGAAGGTGSNNIKFWARDTVNGTGLSWTNIGAESFYGGWHHIVLTGSSAGIKAYFDGNLVGENAANPKTLAGKDQDIYVAVTNWDPSFSGFVDNVDVYTYALSESQVKALDDDATNELIAQSVLNSNVTANSIKGNNESLDNVGSDLKLSTSVAGMTGVAWSSEKPEIITNAGKFMGFPAKDATFKVTVTATYNDKEVSKAFDVTVNSKANYAKKLLDAAFADSKILGENDALNNVKYDLVIPKEVSGLDNVKIVSEKPEYLTNDGKYIAYPEKDTKCKITVKASYDGEELSKVIEITLKPLDKGELNKLIAKAEAIDTTKLSDSFKARLSNAIALAKSAATHSQINDAIADLTELIKMAEEIANYDGAEVNPFAYIIEPPTEAELKAKDTKELLIIPANIADDVTVEYSSNSEVIAKYEDGVLYAEADGLVIVTATVTAKYDGYSIEYSTAVKVGSGITQEEIEEKVSQQNPKRDEAAADKKNKQQIDVDVQQSKDDTLSVTENYVRGKVKSRSINPDIEEVKDGVDVETKVITLNAGTKYKLAILPENVVTKTVLKNGKERIKTKKNVPGTYTIIADDNGITNRRGKFIPKSAAINSKGLMTVKAIKNKPTYSYVVEYECANHCHKYRVKVNVENLEFKRDIKKTTLNSNAEDLSQEVATINLTQVTQDYNSSIVSGIWTVNVGKGNKQFAEYEISKDGRFVTIRPIAGKKGTVKVTVNINGKKYSTSVKVVAPRPKK